MKGIFSCFGNELFNVRLIEKASIFNDRNGKVIFVGIIILLNGFCSMEFANK